MRIRDLPGLGAKTEQILAEIGINSVADLQALGAINTFIKLEQKKGKKPSLNFLYALEGALTNQHWQVIAKNQKEQLLMELEGVKEFTKMFEQTLNHNQKS